MEENRRNVALEHVSSQETHALGEYCDHCHVCARVLVCLCVTAGGVCMNYHTVYL